MIMQKKSQAQTHYWLMKSEGACYSIDDLKRDKKTPWSGVRNFQARNFMRDTMKIGDMVLFYHSNGPSQENPTGVYGLAKIASAPYEDKTARDPKDEHFDPKSKSPTYRPTWFLVDVAFVKKFTKPMPLALIKMDPKLDGMRVREKASRLSIQPVSEKHFKYIVTKCQ